MEIVQVGQEPRTLNRLPLRGPLDLPSRRLVPWHKGQHTCVMVLKEVLCMMEVGSVEAQKSDMQETGLCRVQNEGATTAALVWCQAAGSVRTMLLLAQGGGRQMPEVDTVR